MNFRKHSDLIGEHSFLSPSKYHWLGYDVEKLQFAYSKYTAVQRGIALHDLAMRCIRLKVRLPKIKKSLNQYVNDGIGYIMTPEQPLFYSINAFGTADTISFRDKVLRIHDLKTGSTPVSIDQLEIYSGLFCLEYSVNPFDINIELRIYQTDDVIIEKPDPEYIQSIMDKIVLFDKKIEEFKMEEEQ